MVAYHFCQAHNAVTCQAAQWVHSLAAQLCQAPCLKAYHQLLSTDHHLRTKLSLVECMADPDTALTQAVLLPLAELHLGGKILPGVCLVLIDGLCDARAVAALVEKHLVRFPPWLKIICTVRSGDREVIRGLPFHTVRLVLCTYHPPYHHHSYYSLDNYDVDQRISRDMSDYISLRINKSPSLGKNILLSSNRVPQEDQKTNFQNYLLQCARGNFLYIKLVLDLIERGHLVLKSSNYKVLPQTLSEVFLLEFNLKFPTTKSFEDISIILSILLASRNPLTIEKLYTIVNAVRVSSFLTWNEFLSLYRPLVRYIVRRKDDTLMFFHPLFRDWLNKRSDRDSPKFLCDPRIGHAAISLSISRMGRIIETEQVLELCHHLLSSSLYSDIPSPVSSAYLQAALLALSTPDTSPALGSLPSHGIDNSVQVSQLLLRAGADPDSTPLLCSYAKQGCDDMVSLLVQAGADINQCNSAGESALVLAVREGRLGTVQLLVQSGALVTSMDSAGMSPVVHAASMGYLTIVEYLLAHHWDTAHLRLAAQQATVAASAADKVEILDFLLDMSEVQIDGDDTRMKETPLGAAALKGSKDCCETLLRRGASVSATNVKQETALHLAASNGHWSCCEILIKAGADLDQRDIKGRSVLMVAAIEGQLGVVELLVASHAPIENSDNDGITPAMNACAHGQVEVVRYLVGQGADINHADKTGRTALDLAAYQGNTELVELLLDQGAMVEHVDIHGVRPLDRAVGQGHAEVVSCFLRKGSKLGPSTWAAAEERPGIM